MQLSEEEAGHNGVTPLHSRAVSGSHSRSCARFTSGQCSCYSMNQRLRCRSRRHERSFPPSTLPGRAALASSTSITTWLMSSRVADRIVVLQHGRVAAVVRRGELSLDELNDLLVLGQPPTESGRS